MGAVRRMADRPGHLHGLPDSGWGLSVRNLALVVLLGLLAWAGIGRAEAQAVNCELAGICPKPEAYQKCQAAMQYTRNWAQESNQGGEVVHACTETTTGEGGYFQCGVRIGWQTTCWRPGGAIGQDRFYFLGCPAGTNWDGETGQCTTECGSDGWPDPLNPGQCLNRDKCLAKPVLGAGTVPSGSGACSGGCQYGVSQKGITFNFAGAPGITLTEGWAPTGGQCASGDVAPKPLGPDGECVPLEHNQTACAKPDGRHCHFTPSGKEFCWKPGEVGEKTDGPDLQKTVPGPNPIPPNPQLPSGDELVPSGGPTTTTTTVVNNGSTTTTTTTTNNYTTNFGTNAGSGPGQAEGSGGEGDDGEGEGDGEVSGGGDCAAPPSCSGNPLACWAIRHNWKQACEAADSDLFGGAMGEVMDAFANEQRAEAVTWGAELGNDGEGDLDTHREIREIPLEDLDDSGFLPAGKCPQFDTPTVAGKALPINFGPMCGMLESVGYLVLGLAYMIAFRIIGGGGRR